MSNGIPWGWEPSLNMKPIYVSHAWYIHILREFYIEFLQHGILTVTHHTRFSVEFPT